MMLALADIKLVPRLFGNNCKTTSPFSFTVKNLLVTRDEFGLKLLVKLVNLNPEKPVLPCLISTLLLGVVVPIPTLPSTSIPLSGAKILLASVVLDLGINDFPITTPPFTSNRLEGMMLFPNPIPVFPLLWIKILWFPAPSAKMIVFSKILPANLEVVKVLFNLTLPKKTL